MGEGGFSYNQEDIFPWEILFAEHFSGIFWWEGKTDYLTGIPLEARNNLQNWICLTYTLPSWLFHPYQIFIFI